jgi:glycine amidinotransferase
LNDSTTRTGASAVGAHNEWDPLEEVIVGHVEGAVIPMPHITVTRNVPRNAARFYRLVGGRRYPRILVDAARREVDHFVRLLEAEGVVVRRPDVVDNSVRSRTPFWTSKGYCLACPRDGFLVVGGEIIETPMAWRSRYFESAAYRSLFQEYFATGARWTAAPRPQLTDALFDYKYTPPKPGEPMRYVVNETEPVFDAADFVRCGTDLFGIKSNVTNAGGFEWLRRHLGDRYRVHEVESRCRQPMHIDTTFMPLAPGKLLVNPEYIAVETLPAMFKSWDILIAPDPDPVPRSAWRYKISQCSAWISLNVLMLDEKRVVVEEAQPSLIRALKDWGFSPIPCPFLSYAPFGGSFHCATLDVRRRGPLQSYF